MAACVLPAGLRFGYVDVVMATTVLVGAQWGDEGKGKVIDVLERCSPVYQEFDGWQMSTKQAQDFDQLSKRARVYLQKLAQLSGAKISLVSVRARREETIFL